MLQRSYFPDEKGNFDLDFEELEGKTSREFIHSLKRSLRALEVNKVIIDDSELVLTVFMFRKSKTCSIVKFYYDLGSVDNMILGKDDLEILIDIFGGDSIV